jgi:hypothetical protein
MSEQFSKGTIANGGKGDEYIMTVLDEMDHYLLTPSGVLKRRDKDGYGTPVTAYMKKGIFKIGPGFDGPHNGNDDFLPMTSTEADDPTLPGKVSYPWNERSLPTDMKPILPPGRKPPTPNCLGCYEEVPIWLRKREQVDNK